MYEYQTSGLPNPRIFHNRLLLGTALDEANAATITAELNNLERRIEELERERPRTTCLCSGCNKPTENVITKLCRTCRDKLLRTP